jgi:tetratricopeptide (TPR) repeat protein
LIGFLAVRLVACGASLPCLPFSNCHSAAVELHARAGALLAGDGAADNRGVEPELVAHHLAHAGQPLASARYSAAAAKQALDRWANREALGHTAAGLAQLALADEGVARDQCELLLRMIEGTAHRAVHGFASISVENSFARALTLCERLRETQQVVDVRRGLFSFYYARGELDRAQQQGEEVVRLSERSPDALDTRVLGDWMLGVMAFWGGDFSLAQARLERAVSLYRSHAQSATALALQIDPGVNAWSHLTWVLWILGRPDAALQCGERAVATARELHQPLALAMAQFFSCATLACCGRYDALDAPLAELIAVTTEHRLGYLGSCAKVLRGQQLIARGLSEAGLAQARQALAEFGAQQAQLGLPWLLSIVALGHAGLEQPERALEVIDDALRAIERKGERQWAPEVWRLKAELLLRTGRHAEAQAHDALRLSLELARRQSAKSLELRAATSLAHMLMGRGEVAPARALLAPVRELFPANSDFVDVRAADRLLAHGRANVKQGRRHA